MPSILNLKFKGNKSFVAFSNLNDTESLTKTWKVCTKVASYLEQGQRLENLSWRLWHLQNLMVDTDNAKSKREFKKLSKCMGDKLDKEKGRSIEELEAPDFKRNHSTDMIRQRAVEKERSREASQNAQPGTIKRMQFTFSVDQQAHQAPLSAPVKKPDTRPSAEFTKRTRAAAARAQAGHEDSVMADGDTAPTTPAPPSSTSANSSGTWSSQFLHFPPIFGAGFGPSALLYAAPTLTNPMNYGEGFDPSGANDSFSISRPTIELPLDEILFGDESTGWVPTHEHGSSNTNSINNNVASTTNTTTDNTDNGGNNHNNNNKRKSGNNNSSASQRDVVMQSTPTPAPATVAPLLISLPKKNTSYSSTTNKTTNVTSMSSSSSIFSSDEEEEEEEEYIPSAPPPSSSKRNSVYKNIPPLSQTVKEVLPETVAPSRITSSIYGTRSNTPTSRPHLTVRTQGTVNTRSSGPGATATSLNSAVLRGGTGNSDTGNSLSNSAPGGVKAECSNCGATHTPLWRRGLNDELNCNACGLYCKLHKRPRPKSMRNSHGEGRAQVVPRQETVDVVSTTPLAAQCYNCHTTATPLWRKDDEGKTVCNACGLYYKLHGSTRPISMKSDVIRKRSRHDARRASITGPEDTPSTSSGPTSPRSSPVRDASPTLAPDSTTQLSYDFEDSDAFRPVPPPSSSELMGALGALTGAGPVNLTGDSAHRSLYPPSSPYHPLSSALTSSSGISLFPGPYHPDYLMQFANVAGDALPFSSVDSAEIDATMSPRSNKRRRMSVDSAEEPPQSAVSFGSFSGPTGDNSYSSTVPSTSSHSHSLSHNVTRGHSHSFSLSHNHSHSLSSQVHSHSLSHGHGHAKRSSMEFPFTNYNANGTINSGPVLRGSGNTFWHPPMLPQTGSDNEGQLFHHGSSSSSSSNSNTNSNTNSNSSNSNSNSTNNNSNAAATESGANSSNGSRTTGGGGRNEDSTMDYLHPLPMLQDEDNLFSSFVHPPMVLPDEVGSGGDGNDGNMHTSMYVDSSYYQ